jgi:hypothetical protein
MASRRLESSGTGQQVAEAVADVVIAGIAVTPPGPEPDGVLDGRASSP